MYDQIILVATKDGHAILRTELIRSVGDRPEGGAWVQYGDGEDLRVLEVAWTAERIYRAIREASNAS